MEEPVIDYAKEYLLLHEILSALRFPSMQIVSSGSEAQGMIPIYETFLNGAFLHFGTLVDFVNDPMKYRSKEFAPFQINNMRIKTNEANTSKYSFDEVAVAIETLKSRNEVGIENKRDLTGTTIIDKVISLTKEGMTALNNKYYQKEYLRQRQEDRTYSSTMKTNDSISETNFWMKVFTGVLAVGALIEVIKFFLDYVCKK